MKALQRPNGETIKLQVGSPEQSIIPILDYTGSYAIKTDGQTKDRNLGRTGLYSLLDPELPTEVRDMS